jgi:hypothetical protein
MNWWDDSVFHVYDDSVFHKSERISTEGPGIQKEDDKDRHDETTTHQTLLRFFRESNKNSLVVQSVSIVYKMW